MRRLLSANFLWLKKSTLFRGTVILGFVMGVVFAFMSFTDKVEYERGGYVYSFSMDGMFFRYVLLAGIAMAMFIPLFFGTEYDDGTIRNKLVVGHFRLSIYFANLITATAAAFAFCGAYMLGALAVGAPLLGWFEMSLKTFLVFFVGTLVTTAAFAALYTLITMAFTRKATAAVVCVLAIFGMLASSFTIYTKLEAAEYITGYSLTADGEFMANEPTPNPKYLQGAKRKVYRFLYDFNPGGQAMQYTNMETENVMLLSVYSIVVFTVSTGAGSVMFRKKDLK